MKIITPAKYFKEVCYDVYYDNFFDNLEDYDHLILLLEKLCQLADDAAYKAMIRLMSNGG